MTGAAGGVSEGCVHIAPCPFTLLLPSLAVLLALPLMPLAILLAPTSPLPLAPLLPSTDPACEEPCSLEPGGEFYNLALKDMY